ncbi:MAG TPA: hypothetical protein VIN56_05095 [Candidatus Dormibacteraeota bacterium]|jgi:hypothetical protein
MNRKLLAPAAAGLAFAAGVLSVQAGFTGPLRQPVNQQLDAIFGKDGISVGAGAGDHNIVVHAARPATDPTFDTADQAVQAASDLADGAVSTATDAANGTIKTATDTATAAADGALTLAGNTVDSAKSTVDSKAATAGQTDLTIDDPTASPQWNDRQLLQRSITFNADNSSHSVELKVQKESADMYGLQLYVDGNPTGDEVNVYSSTLQLDGLDVPVVVPVVRGTVNLVVSYGYFASGPTCLLSVGNDAPCAMSGPNPQRVAQLRPEITVNAAWTMLGQPAGSQSVRTPLY